jgi:hypothetical protein
LISCLGLDFGGRASGAAPAGVVVRTDRQKGPSMEEFLAVLAFAALIVAQFLAVFFARSATRDGEALYDSKRKDIDAVKFLTKN